MAATLIVFQQLEFFQSQSVGFEKENLLVVNNAEKLGKQLESFRNEISQIRWCNQCVRYQWTYVEALKIFICVKEIQKKLSISGLQGR